MPKINQFPGTTTLATTDVMVTETSTGTNTRKIAYSDFRTQIQNESKSVFALKGEVASDAQVADAVGDWLDAHVTPTGSTVAIDDTLLIQGAAADAKATGEMIIVNSTSTNGTRVNITTTNTDVELAEMSDVNDLKNALNSVATGESYNVYPVWQLGYLHGLPNNTPSNPGHYSGGDNTLCTTDYISVADAKKIYFDSTTYKLCVVWYDSNKVQQGYTSGFVTSPNPFVLDANYAYCVPELRRNDNATISDASVANGTLYYTKTHPSDIVRHDELDDAIGIETIPIQEKGKYLSTSSGVVDVNNPHTSSTGYGYSIVPCSPGDVFRVSGVSAYVTPMAWCFTNSSYTALMAEEPKITVTNKTVVAPDNSAYLIIHDIIPYRLSYKGEDPEKALKIEDFKNKIIFNSFSNPYGEQYFTYPNSLIQYDLTDNAQRFKANFQLPVIKGCKVQVTATGYVLILSKDITPLGSWTNDTFSYTITDDSVKTLGIWIKKSDGSVISDSDVANILSALWIQYYPLAVNDAATSAPQFLTSYGYKWIDDKHITNYGVVAENSSGRSITYYIPCPAGASIDYAAESNKASVAGISFYDIDKRFISGYSNNASENSKVSVIAPENTAYCRISAHTANKAISYVNIKTSGIADVFDASMNRGAEKGLQKVERSLANGITTENLATSDVFSNRSGVTETGNEYIIGAGGWLFGYLYLYDEFTDFARIQFETVGTTTGALLQYRYYHDGSLTTYNFDNDGTVWYKDFTTSEFQSSGDYIQVTIDNRQGSNTITIKNLVCYTDKMYINMGVSDFSGNATFYVSTTGSDSSGDGSTSSPFATVNKALSSGAAKVMVNAGVYNQTINLSNAKTDTIEIASNTTNGRAVFVHPDAFVSDSETKVSGYTNVYSCDYTGSFYETSRLYQDGVPEAATLISDSERNPYQRGQEYRCLDTKIMPCSSATLSDALTEIDNTANGYKYYYDSTNSKLYFSRPQTVSSSYPIMRSTTSAFITGLSRNFKLNIYGIEAKYMTFKVNGAIAHLEDCKASNAYAAGGFAYDTSISTEFVRCEACGTHGGSTGDGFNGHASSTGDKYSKQTTVRLVDCWSHDNNDDGYSDHERSEIEIYGGLYEYNGKAGVTPSFGSHCACYGVLSRNNNNGFYYVGAATVEEGGKYGQMLCVSCVAENNISGGRGFGVSANGNSAMCVDCKSIGNKYGYSADANTIMTLIDCGAASNTVSVKNGEGTFVIKNTTLVT